MKARGQETIDDLIAKTPKSDFLSTLTKSERNPIHWLHWLDILDQQTSSQRFSGSHLDSALDFKGSRQQETLRFEPKTGKGSATKDPLDSSVKSGNMFERGLQASGDKYQQLKFPEAMVAIAQAAKDLPGWPLMSSKMQMHKCEKCSQEFCSPLNQRRHMRATHRRPLNGDKEDLKKKREQIAAFWDKLSLEEACEIVSAKNLSLMDLSAASVVRALSTQLQQPSLLLLPQTYIKVATALLDIVQNKSFKVPLKSVELFAILDDASEKNLLCGVTSSSMHRCIFDSEPGRVGLETKNLVASLGFLVEYRLVRAWMDDKDAEALRCQKALVEEEEAAQRKRAKILERKKQRKLRQKEFKDKERKTVESSSCLQELKFDPFPREGEDSLTATQSSPSSSGYSGLDSHPLETPQMAHDFEDANNCTSLANGLEDRQSCGDPNGLEGTGSGCFGYESSKKLVPQGDSLEESGARPFNGPVVGSGIGWKDRRDVTSPYLSRQPYSKDRRHYDHHYGGQRLTRTPFGNSAFEYSTPRYIHYREKVSMLKRPAAVAGTGHAVWARKTPQIPAAVSQHSDNGEVGGEVGDDSTGARLVRQIELFDVGDKSSPRRPKGLNRGSSLSSDSITSHSSGSISARVGAEEQETTDDMMVPVSFSPQIASDFTGSGELVIGSVTIPLGDPLSSNQVNVESSRDSEEKDVAEIDGEVKSNLPDKTRSSPATCENAEGPELLRTTSLRKASVTPKCIPAHQSSGREDNTTQSKNLGLSAQNKSAVVKVWRPVTPGERNSPRAVCPSSIFVERSDAANTPGCGGGVGDTLNRELRDQESVFTLLSGEAGQEPAGSYYSEIASFLSQRWQEAISSSEIECYGELDAIHGVSGDSVV